MPKGKKKPQLKKRRWYLGEKTLTKHHIIPTSREGRDDEENITLVPNGLHQLYHFVFGNLMPVEIITWLVETFWNGQWTWVEMALERRSAMNEKAWRKVKIRQPADD